MLASSLFFAAAASLVAATPLAASPAALEKRAHIAGLNDCKHAPPPSHTVARRSVQFPVETLNFVLVLFSIDADLPPSAVLILNYALTLEHLEDFFYADGLRKYSVQAFASAGYPAWVRERVSEISYHERGHVKFVADTIKSLNGTAVAPWLVSISRPLRLSLR